MNTDGTRERLDADATRDLLRFCQSQGAWLRATIDTLVRLESPSTDKIAVDRPPLERSAAVLRLYQRAVTVAAAVGRELPEGAAGGGSDGNFTAALGVPTLDGLGPRGDGAHAVHEHVLVEDLAWRAAFVAGLIASFGHAH